MRKPTTTKPAFSPAERRNWGFWDGTAARERGRYPEWASREGVRYSRHFDKSYLAGFVAGWYDEGHPTA